MAKNETTVVRLDKKSIDAITNLTKAVKAQTEIIKRNQRPYTLTPGANPGGVPPHFSTGGYTGGQETVTRRLTERPYESSTIEPFHGLTVSLDGDHIETLATDAARQLGGAN